MVKNTQELVGKKLYYFNTDTKSVEEFIVEFVGKDSVIRTIDGEFEAINLKDLYETENEALSSNPELTIVAFCREIDRTNGNKIFYIVSDDVMRDQISPFVLSIRSRMNAELRYFFAYKSVVNEDTISEMDDELLEELLEDDRVIECDERYNNQMKKGAWQ